MPKMSDLNPAGRWTLILVLVLLTLTCLAYLVDARTLHGVSVWSKPIKFNLSVFIHIATLLFLVALLRPEVQHSTKIRTAMGVACTAFVMELLYIAFQAARGRASHFNTDTTWEEVAYGIMGVTIVIAIMATIVIGAAVWRGARSEIGPGLRTGAALGAVVGSLATLITAGAMSSMQLTPTGHWVGGDLSDAHGLPIVGWSTTGGDLRVPHFFSTHLIQVLAVVGWMSDRFSPRYPRAPVWLVAAGGLIVVVLTFNEAMSAEPFLRLAAD